jgi:hypothetical protein
MRMWYNHFMIPIPKKGMKKPQEKGVFVRLGPVNGQYQTHRPDTPGEYCRVAPAKRGIWAFPIQFANELTYYGGYNDYRPRLVPTKKEQDILDRLDGEITGYYDSVAWRKGMKEYEKFESMFRNKKFKNHYKRINLKMTQEVWCHLPAVKDVEEMNDSTWPWYKVSVREFWHRARRYMTVNWEAGLYEIFIEM